jgi:hypothetical protein
MYKDSNYRKAIQDSFSKSKREKYHHQDLNQDPAESDIPMHILPISKYVKHGETILLENLFTQFNQISKVQNSSSCFLVSHCIRPMYCGNFLPVFRDIFFFEK